MTSTAIPELRERITAHALELARAAADTTVDETKAGASRRTGELVEGIHHTEPVENGGLILCEIRSEAEYSLYQDEGTGEYGPRAAPIVMMPGQGPMIFFWDAVGAWRSLYRSHGAPGRHFFHEPMERRWRESLIGNMA